MKKTQLAIWIATIFYYIAWDQLRRSISPWIYSNLTAIGIPHLTVQLILLALPIVVLLEVVLKLFFLSLTFRSPKFVPAQPEDWKGFNQDKLNDHTSEFEKLGFVYLTDYTLLSHQCMARLFVHPQKFCFAELGQHEDFPIFCSISCSLEKQWSLAVTNMRPSAISFSFQRQPRGLVKHLENKSENLMFQSLLDFREQASSDLGLKLVQDMRAETYFELERKRTRDRRRSFLYSSVIWRLLKLLWFSLNPQDEYLGAYSKLKGKR